MWEKKERCRGNITDLVRYFFDIHVHFDLRPTTVELDVYQRGINVVSQFLANGGCQLKGGVVYQTMDNVAFRQGDRGPCTRRKTESKYSGRSIYAYVKEVRGLICYHSAKRSRFDIKHHSTCTLLL